MKTAIYTRVSSEESHKQGYSIAEQRESCRAYAAAQGYTDVREFNEPKNISGETPLADRPGFAKLLEYEPDVIIVWRIDRLTRTAKHIFDVLERFRLLSAQESGDDFVKKILAVFAEKEREDIRLRTMAGQRRARLDGKPGGKPPLGFRRAADKRIVKDPETYPVIEEIFRLRNQGMSGHSIAKKTGIPSGTVYNVLRRKAHGKRTAVKRSGQTRKPPKYMLTGVVLCPKCGYRLGVDGGKVLTCPRGDFSIIYRKAWEQITHLLENFLQDARWYKPTPEDEDKEYGLMVEIADCEGKTARLIDAYKDGLITKDEFASHREPLDKKAERIRKKLDITREQAQQKANLAESLKYIDIFHDYVEAGDVVRANKMLRIIFPNGVPAFFKRTPDGESGAQKCSIQRVARNILSLLEEAMQD